MLFRSLDRRFGRCEFFIIYDTETKESVSIVNSGASAAGGAGIAAASQILEHNPQVVITGNLGPNAFEIIEKAEVKAYSCEVVSITEAVEKYQKNELSLISAAGGAHHGM